MPRKTETERSLSGRTEDDTHVETGLMDTVLKKTHTTRGGNGLPELNTNKRPTACADTVKKEEKCGNVKISTSC